jgi:hypothetical protein
MLNGSLNLFGFQQDVIYRKKIMWLTYAYQGTSTHYVISTTKLLIVNTRWITKQEFIFGKIKGTI